MQRVYYTDSHDVSHVSQDVSHVSRTFRTDSQCESVKQCETWMFRTDSQTLRAVNPCSRPAAPRVEYYENPRCSHSPTRIRIKFTQDSLCFAHVSRCFARVSRTFRGMFRTFRACFARFRGCFARLRIDHPPAKFTFCTVGAHILTFCA